MLSLNNNLIDRYIHIIYPPELEIKDTTDTSYSASYLDIFLEYDSKGNLSTKLYDKRDDFSFPIVNFPFMSSNIPQSPAYGVFVSQLIRYARACTEYTDFLERGKLLCSKLLTQGFVKSKLVTSLKKFYGRHHNLVSGYCVSVSQLVREMFFDT